MTFKEFILLPIEKSQAYCLGECQFNAVGICNFHDSLPSYLKEYTEKTGVSKRVCSMYVKLQFSFPEMIKILGKHL